MLGDKARDRSVNRFQGKDAHIAIYSITLSSPLSARVIDFALYANRISVAVSPTKNLSNLFALSVIIQLFQYANHLRIEFALFTKISDRNFSSAQDT
jgi:hypothetical protein